MEKVVYPFTSGRVWGRFHHRVAYRLTGSQPRRGWYGKWVYPPLEDVRAEAGLQEVETYISCLHNTVAQFIAAITIMDICMAEERRPGSRVSKR